MSSHSDRCTCEDCMQRYDAQWKAVVRSYDNDEANKVVRELLTARMARERAAAEERRQAAAGPLQPVAGWEAF